MRLRRDETRRDDSWWCFLSLAFVRQDQAWQRRRDERSREMRMRLSFKDRKWKRMNHSSSCCCRRCSFVAVEVQYRATRHDPSYHSSRNTQQTKAKVEDNEDVCRIWPCCCCCCCFWDNMIIPSAGTVGPPLVVVVVVVVVVGLFDLPCEQLVCCWTATNRIESSHIIVDAWRIELLLLFRHIFGRWQLPPRVVLWLLPFRRACCCGIALHRATHPPPVVDVHVQVSGRPQKLVITTSGAATSAGQLVVVFGELTIDRRCFFVPLCFYCILKTSSLAARSCLLISWQ